MYDEQHFTRDAARVVFHDTDGITVDDDGDATINWDKVETVRIENPPHAEAFGTKDFYKLPATVAKPIRQPYQFRDQTVWLKKPREELKRAAWSLENAPWTMDHPDTGMVKNVDDIRGFWKDPRYIDRLDDLDTDLYVPVDDEEAQDFISENGDVSVGFYNRVARTDEYDGVVGGEDADVDSIDGYQTNLYFDHVASVRTGRCSGEAGCGIDAAQHGHMTDAFISATRPTGISSERGMDPVPPQDRGLDQSKFVNPDDDKWYAVPPSDNPDDSWKFPINNCDDATDAWNLRGSGEISISQETLEGRIKRRASSLGCDLPDTATEDSIAESADRYDVAPGKDATDCGCGCDDTLKLGDNTLTISDGKITIN